MYSNFDGVIVFRGTNSDLENENLLITLYDTTGIFRKIISQKIVNLRGILDFERVKTELTLVDQETKDKYSVPVEGYVNIDSRPKYKQSGENVVLLSTKKYLCINIMRVENIRPAETRGIVDSFISVEWTGLVQRSRTVKENNNPTFNEIIYFQVPLPQEHIMNPEKYVQKINEEFLSKNEVVFNLMIEGDDNTYDNLGIAFFHLSDIKDSERQEKKYFADDLKKDKKYITRIYTGKSKMVSAFSLSNNTYIHFEAWFLDDFPAIVDFGEKKKRKSVSIKYQWNYNRILKMEMILILKNLKLLYRKYFKNTPIIHTKKECFMKLNRWINTRTIICFLTIYHLSHCLTKFIRKTI